MRHVSADELKRWAKKTAITVAAVLIVGTSALAWLWHDRASLDEVDWPAYPAIEPSIDAATLKQAGVTPLEHSGDDLFAMLVLEGESGPEYWLGLNNFYMITRYNRSVNYAMSVHQLAREIRAARESRGR